MKLKGILQLKKMVNKISVIIEQVDWSNAELRSNEIDIAHDHLRNALREFEEIIQWR